MRSLRRPHRPARHRVVPLAGTILVVAALTVAACSSTSPTTTASTGSTAPAATKATPSSAPTTAKPTTTVAPASTTPTSSSASGGGSTTTAASGSGAPTIERFTITPSQAIRCVDGRPQATMSWSVTPADVAISFLVDGQGSGTAQAGYTATMSDQALPPNLTCGATLHTVTLVAGPTQPGGRTAQQSVTVTLLVG